MTQYGMTSQGFVPKRLSDIIFSLNDRIGDIVDPATGEFPFQNATDDSILQQVLGVVAEGLSECWEAGYDGSVQFDPLKNSGAGQAGTVQLNAMLLKAGAQTLCRQKVMGKNGTTIPKGARVATEDGLQTYTFTEPVFIGANGEAEGQVQCTVKGAVSPKDGTVISIQTPTEGWLGTTNLETLAVGSAQETEGEVRRRQQRSTSLTSYRQIEAIYAAVVNVPGVIYCRAYQNSKTYPVDERGIPFKEVAAVVEGGDPREIASVIFYRLGVSQLGYGNTVEVFYDTQGISYPIAFSRPFEKVVAVTVDVEILNRSLFPDNGAALIQQAIIDYAQYGGTGNEDGFPPGADVICTRLYTPVNTIAGHKVTRLVIGLGGLVSEKGDVQFSEADIPIAWNEVARFYPENITVNVRSAGT